MPGDPDLVNPPHTYKSFRHTQSINSVDSLHMSMYKATIMLALDNNNEIDIAKHRYRDRDNNLSVDEAVEVMMDMLCRMIFKGRMEMFQEALKKIYV